MFLPLSGYVMPDSTPENRWESQPRIRYVMARYRWRLTAIAAIAGGVGTVAMFAAAMWAVDPAFYSARDDAIITLSHARNLVDFGFVGVNPSGERIDGFSAPLQFVLYTVTYAVSGLEYRLFFKIQNYGLTFLLGIALFYFMKSIDLQGVTALAATLFAVAMMTFSTHFLIFHHCGLENPITHLTLVVMFVALTFSCRGGRVYYGLIPLALLAACSRYESIYYVLPLLGVYALTYSRRHGDRRAWIVPAGFLVLWSILLMVRILYFNDLLPNTAHAQDISIFRNLRRLFAFSGLLKGAKTSYFFVWHLTGFSLLIGSGLLLVASTRQREHLFTIAGMITVLVLGMSHAFVFGPARLAEHRTVSFLTIFSGLFLTYAIFTSRLSVTVRIIVVIAVALPAGFFFRQVVPPFDLCCRTEDFARFRSIFLDLMERHGLPRPFVANPDLGLMSFHKNFNVIDLGYLGSRTLTDLKRAPILKTEYILRIAKPDFIEIHGCWSCREYGELFRNSKFASMYEAIAQRPTVDECSEQCPEAKDGIFMRTAVKKGSDTPVRRFIDDLAEEISLERIAQELSECRGDRSRDCVDVTKTVFRFLPEIRRLGLESAVLGLFQNLPPSPYKEWSMTLLRSSAKGTIEDVEAAFLKHLLGTDHAHCDSEPFKDTETTVRSVYQHQTAAPSRRGQNGVYRGD